MKNRVSVVLPAKNEAASLVTLLPLLRAELPAAEIIIVDDGSTDETAAICQQHDVKLVRHPYSLGNGAAVKTGARVATGEIIVFMDADGQHQPSDVARLIARIDEGYDMVIGARDKHSHANVWRRMANNFYNSLAGFMSGQPVKDLTSGLRATRAERFREFLYLLPNGFSYPTTSTMAFFRAGYSIDFIPVHVEKRLGKSHINVMRDGLRFILIIVKIGTLYSPLKFFVPISLALFLIGAGYYIFTFATMGRFTNMSALLFSTSVLTFLIGLVSEQITTLVYRR